MYNQASWLFSVGGGLAINQTDGTLDFSNLRIYLLLSRTVNGWATQADGTYQLIFRSSSLCDGCEVTIHLYGSVVPVPVPAAFWLLGSGIVGLLGVVQRKRVRS